MRTLSPAPTVEDMLLQYEVEQFFYHESALLDARRFEEWFALLADDLVYWMPVRATRSAGDIGHEFAPFGSIAFFDEDKASMEQRVKRLRTGFAWAEDPPSRTRHFVNNVRIVERHAKHERAVSCNFIGYRSRLASDEDFWIGRREDVVRKEMGSWTIAQRHIFLDHVSLTSKNLSIFF